MTEKQTRARTPAGHPDARPCQKTRRGDLADTLDPKVTIAADPAAIPTTPDPQPLAPAEDAAAREHAYSAPAVGRTFPARDRRRADPIGSTAPASVGTTCEPGPILGWLKVARLTVMVFVESGDGLPRSDDATGVAVAGLAPAANTFSR